MTGVLTSFPLPVLAVDAIKRPGDHFNCDLLLPGRRSILSAATCIGRQSQGSTWSNGRIRVERHDYDQSPCPKGCEIGRRVAAQLPGYKPPGKRAITEETHSKLREARAAYQRQAFRVVCPWCETTFYREPRRNPKTCGKPACVLKAKNATRDSTYPNKCSKCGKRCRAERCRRHSNSAERMRKLRAARREALAAAARRSI